MRDVQANETIMLMGADGKRHIVQPTPGGSWSSNRGHIAFDEIIGQPTGRVITTQLGHEYLILRPTTADLILHLKRTTQIVYPKDAAQLVMELDLWDGKRLIEAGTGSGGLTLAFARAVMPGGRVYSYEARDEHQRLARRNLEKLGLASWVDFKLRDIAEGFDEREVDAVFLDVREADQFIPQVEAALADGGMFGALLPTANQLSALAAALQDGDFVDVRFQELLVRTWKPVPDRLRPADRMIAHTGFLVFARKINARFRTFYMDKRQRRRAVEYGQWPPTSNTDTDDA